MQIWRAITTTHETRKVHATTKKNNIKLLAKKAHKAAMDTVKSSIEIEVAAQLHTHIYDYSYKHS